jgi:hypothetical protein
LQSFFGKPLWRASLDDLPSSRVITFSACTTQYIAVVVGLCNNHINDLSDTYNNFRKHKGESVTTFRGGAQLGVRVLDPSGFSPRTPHTLPPSRKALRRDRAEASAQAGRSRGSLAA